MTFRVRLLAVFGGSTLALLGLASAAWGCFVCLSMPDESLADKVTAAEAVALLRPAAEDPFRYMPVEFLKGGPAVPDVPFLVPRSMAAALAADPEAAVVATWSDGTGWTLHELASPLLVSTLATVIAADLSSPEARRDFFAPLVLHDDPALWRMAMIEVATLPYPVLRDTGLRVDRLEVAQMLAVSGWPERVPVMILLLGLSDAPDDIDFIHRSAELFARNRQTALLDAWVTAFLEVDERAGLDWVRAEYIDVPGRSDAELGQIGFALANHACRTDEAGATIRNALGTMVEARPALAGPLARALLACEDWSLAPDFARWLDQGRFTAPQDEFLVSHYVLAAAERSEAGP